jgi:hypothetical protein
MSARPVFVSRSLSSVFRDRPQTSSTGSTAPGMRSPSGTPPTPGRSRSPTIDARTSVIVAVPGQPDDYFAALDAATEAATVEFEDLEHEAATEAATVEFEDLEHEMLEQVRGDHSVAMETLRAAIRHADPRPWSVRARARTLGPTFNRARAPRARGPRARAIRRQRTSSRGDPPRPRRHRVYGRPTERVEQVTAECETERRIRDMTKEERTAALIKLERKQHAA